MAASSQTVAEIFIAAGKAFNELGAMTMQLHPSPDIQPNSKWTVAEVDALHAAVKTFGDDLNKIAEKMKCRTVSQVKQKVKDEMLSSTGDDSVDASEEPPTKQVKTEVVAPTTSSSSTTKGKSTTADDTTSDVESVTIYPELQVDEDASSEDDASDVDV